MRFVIFGAGAIGGVVGARLRQAGRAVTLIARADYLNGEIVLQSRLHGVPTPVNPALCRLAARAARRRSAPESFAADEVLEAVAA